MNSKIKIILWGVSGNATPEETKQLYALGLPLTVLEGESKVASELSSAHLIIAHDGLPNDFQQPNNVWLIYTGGSKSDTQPNETSRPGNISWNTFFENVRNFHSLVKGKSKVTKEDIGTLYVIDPKLEKLLSTFVTASPFEETGEAVEDLKKVKADLHVYVENYVKRQRKS